MAKSARTASSSAPQTKAQTKAVTKKPTRRTKPVAGFSPVEEIITEIKAGRLVVVVDDESRENEGDLIGAASLITPEKVNFMITHGRGMLCVPVTPDAAARLSLTDMVPHNREAFRTHFTVTVDAAQGVTTGVSAKDRAKTIRALADPRSTQASLVQPGHIQPLIARPGGVLRRAGHTEAAVDLARLAKLPEAGVLIEIMNPDGSMARVPDLKKFSHKHGLKICTIEALIEYRRQREKLIEKIECIEMPTDFGTFQLHLYRSCLDKIHHVALVMGEVTDSQPVLVRVHSECLTGDVFTSRRCDCGSQLHTAMRRIAEEGRGVLVYMRGHEGRGIGLASKIQAYKLQEQGYDTVDANLKLGFPMDLRDYGVGAQIIYDLGVRKIRLMTNNPRKVVGLDGHQLQIVERVPVRSQAKPENARYLATKKKRLGHLL